MLSFVSMLRIENYPINIQIMSSIRKNLPCRHFSLYIDCRYSCSRLFTPEYSSETPFSTYFRNYSKAALYEHPENVTDIVKKWRFVLTWIHSLNVGKLQFPKQFPFIILNHRSSVPIETTISPLPTLLTRSLMEFRKWHSL